MNKIKRTILLVENGQIVGTKAVTPEQLLEMQSPNLDSEAKRKALFGIKLKQIREENGISQSQLAEAIRKKTKKKCTNLAVSSYENGRRYPTLDGLTAICEIFSVSSDYLLSLSDKEELKTGKRQTFTDRINAKMAIKGLSSAELAFLVDMHSDGNIKRELEWGTAMMHGTQDTQVGVLPVLADVLDTTVDDLIGF